MCCVSAFWATVEDTGSLSALCVWLICPHENKHLNRNTDFLQKKEDSSYLKGLLNKWLLFYGMEIINLYVSVNLHFGWVLFS